MMVVTLTFDSSPIKGEGDSVGCVVLLSSPPCGYCLKASMTGAGASFPRRRESTGWCCLVSPSDPVSSTGTGLSPLP